MTEIGVEPTGTKSPIWLCAWRTLSSTAGRNFETISRRWWRPIWFSDGSQWSRRLEALLQHLRLS